MFFLAALVFPVLAALAGAMFVESPPMVHHGVKAQRYIGSMHACALLLIASNLTFIGGSYRLFEVPRLTAAFLSPPCLASVVSPFLGLDPSFFSSGWGLVGIVCFRFLL